MLSVCFTIIMANNSLAGLTMACRVALLISCLLCLGGGPLQQR